MKFSDHSIESILGLHTTKDALEKKEVRGEVIEKDLEKLKHYYNNDKHPTGEDIEQIAQELNIKTSVIKGWFRNQRQQERKTLQPRKHSLSPVQKVNQPILPKPTISSPPTASSQTASVTPPSQRTITPSHQAITSPLSHANSVSHPYFQIITEKMNMGSVSIPHQSQQQLYQGYPQSYGYYFMANNFNQYPVSACHQGNIEKPLDLSKSRKASSPGVTSQVPHPRQPTEPINKTTKAPKVTNKKRSTPSPKSLTSLIPSPEFGSGLRQLVIEGRSFSP